MDSKMDAKFGHADSKFELLRSEFADVKASLYELRALMEEQYAKNAIVLDGLTNLFLRQERSEKRVDEVEKTIADFRR